MVVPKLALTAIRQVAFSFVFSTIAVMVVSPSESASTFPASSTEATPGLLEVQITVSLAKFAGVIVTFSRIDVLVNIEALVWSNAILAYSAVLKYFPVTTVSSVIQSKSRSQPLKT